MTAKLFAICFLICIIDAVSASGIEEEFEDLGRKISEGFKKAEKAVINELHKVEHVIKENPDLLDNVKREFDNIGQKISDGFEGAETAVGDVYKKVEHIAEEDYYVDKTVVSNVCSCTMYSCGCCAHVKEKQIDLNATICTNITYLVYDYGISFTVTINHYPIYNETISVRNPPPVCLGVPYVKELAEVCVRLYDIDARERDLHICIRIEARMKTILVAKYNIGCFDIGPGGVISDVLIAYVVNKQIPPQNETGAVVEHTENGAVVEHTENGAVVEHTETTPNIGSVLILTSNMETPAFTTEDKVITVDDVILAKLDESESEKSPDLLIPVVASVGAIILIGLITLVVYIAIKKRRDEHRAVLQFMKRYGSTTSLVPEIDPYC